jgi:hypothetical protein
MPGAFPAAPPVITGDLVTISRFLQSPAAIARRLRDFRDLRFVSDQLLTGRYRSQGGAVSYEQSEPFVTDRTVESVAAGSVYPYAHLPVGTAAIAAIQKWGQKTLLTDEEIIRLSEELDVDLVVVGSKGKSTIARALMGSDSETIVRYSRYPVLVVRG